MRLRVSQKTPWQSISARLRDLRKWKFGSHTINRRHIANGLFEYQFVENAGGQEDWKEALKEDISVNAPNRHFHILPAYSKPSTCSGCVLEHDGIGFATAEGTCANGVLILGEALGPTEAKEGLPFRPSAPSGAMLDKVLKMCGYTRDAFGIFNVCACLPPNLDLGPYERAATQHCRVHLKQVLEHYRPRAILALGNVPLRSLTGFAGKKQTIDHLRGFVLESPEFPDIPIVASYHPSYLQRGAFNLIPVLRRDIKYAVRVASAGFHPAPVDYVTSAGLTELSYIIYACEQDPTLIISEDFETEGNANLYEDQQLMHALEELYGEPTARKKTKKKREQIGTKQQITQINLSIKPRQSFVFGYTPDVMDGIRRLNALPNPKVGHNAASFDTAVAEYNGCPWAGEIFDSMLCFHHLFPDVPGRVSKSADELDGTFANLQYCASFYGFEKPWKHLVNDQPEWYGACDSDATLRLFHGVKRDMESIRYGATGPTIWDGYCKLVRDLWPILRSASVRGIPVNREKMLVFLDRVVKQQREIGKRIQGLIDPELIPTKHKLGLKRKPKDTEGYELRDFELEPENVKCKCFRVRKNDVEYWASVPHAEVSEKDGKLRAPNPECADCHGEGFTQLPARTETRWCQLLPFNPNSPVQMKAYANFHHHKIPKNKDGRVAMDKWALEQMALRTRDPLYTETREYRKMEKMGSYVIGWMPHEDGRAHPEFSFFPATGQLSSFAPNAQNTPNVSKYGPLAEGFRQGIEAPDGYKIVELDAKSFHVQTLGFEADCPEYIRLGKIDVHSYIACVMEKVAHVDECLDWEDEELRAWLKWYRKNYVAADGTSFEKIRNERAKVAILAFGLGQQSSSLFTSNRDSFVPNWYLEKRGAGEIITAAMDLRADREGQAVADSVHAALNEQFPKLKRFRDNTPLVAKQQGNKLVSRYGCIRWFWDIQHWDSRRQQMVRGVDWEKAIAFPVQNSAHGYLKYAMLRMNEQGMLDRYGFINCVHDSIVFCCKSDLVEECVHNVGVEFSKPSEVMVFGDGTPLSIEMEGKVGANWSDMEEIKV